MSTMTRRECLSVLGGTCAAALAPFSEAGPVRNHPNVIVLLSDDQGYGDLSSHGNPWLKTPNLDRFATQGTECTRFYVSPLCSPSRASILTGRYNLRCGVHGVTRGFQTMHSGETTLATAFRANGYRTAIFGKWHLGSVYPYVPFAEGFEEFIGFREGHEINYWNSMLEHNGNPYPVKGFITDVLTDEGIRYIENHQHEPFFLYMAYNVPHTPEEAPRALFEHYAKMNISKYDAGIYAMMANLDSNIGRLLQRVDDLSLTGDTIVIFLSDNGPNGHRYNCNFLGIKGDVNEGGVRVPFFIRWPGQIPQGHKNAEMVAHIDLYPTLMALCNITPPKGRPIDGIDLSPTLQTGKPLADRLFFTHKPSDKPQLADAGAVRNSRFCLVNREKLYDIIQDPDQKNDIASHHPQEVAALSKAYENWFRDVTAHVSYGRPLIPVGYSEENPVTLPATQAYFSGELHFWGRHGWAWDWITGWSRVQDEIYWDIDVVQDGEYLVDIRYLCPAEDVGSRIQVVAGMNRTSALVRYPTQMDPIPTLDLTPRKEVPPMPWGTLDAGVLRLSKGRTKLYLKALSKTGNNVMEVKAAVLRRIMP